VQRQVNGVQFGSVDNSEFLRLLDIIERLIARAAKALFGYRSLLPTIPKQSRPKARLSRRRDASKKRQGRTSVLLSAATTMDGWIRSLKFC
jgi:hypothetical protein